MKNITVKDVKKMYPNSDTRTIEFMELVVSELESEYKTVPLGWNISLSLLADQLDLYYKCLDAINSEGLQPLDSGRRTAKHNLIPVMQTCESKIFQLLQQFALQPFSRAKMRKLESSINSDEDYDIEELLK